MKSKNSMCCLFLVLGANLCLCTDGIAVDWVNNKLYWTDAIYTMLDVIDLNTLQRKTLIDFTDDAFPRAIVVDPSTR